MKRRQALKLLSLGGVGGITSLAGCSIPLGGSGDDEDHWETDTPTPEPEAAQGTFQYFFNDQTGTLGNIGGDVPEDAPDWQVVNNTLEEDDWKQMETNDLTGEGAVNSRSITELWDTRVNEGTIEEVRNATRDNFDNPRQRFEDTSYNLNGDRNIWNQHDALIYTASLAKAIDDHTDIASSAYMDWTVPSMAEPFLEQMDIEIPGYSLSTLMTTEAGDPDHDRPVEEQAVPRDVAREDEEGQRMKVGSGLAHPTGLLQYEDEEGNQEIKLAEVIGGVWRGPTWIREPEESLYGRPLEEGPLDLANQEMHPAHYVSAFHYDKAREIQEMGGFKYHGKLDSAVMGGLLHMVDDVQNDKLLPGDEDGRSKAYGRTPGWDIVVEDSFGRSVQDYLNNPSREKTKNAEYAGRAFMQVMKKQGWDEPLRVSGTLNDPTYEHLARDEFEDIIDQRAERFTPSA